MKHTFTTFDGNSVDISKEDIDCYRSTGYTGNCIFYLKDSTEIIVKETFKEIDEIFDL